MADAKKPNELLFDQGDPEHLFAGLDEIGRGSFGSVFKTRNVETNQIVAVKVVPRYKTKKDHAARIAKEVGVLRALDHPNIVAIRGAYTKGNDAWIAMDYCLCSCADLIGQANGSLSEAEIASIMWQLMQALRYIHAKDLMHRDVKGANILLTADGLAKLGDFGSATNHSPANTFIGTPYWMAPEMIVAMEKGTYTSKVDIWSAGITAIELAQGKPPLIQMNAMSALYQIPTADPPTLDSPDGWSDKFKMFIAQCLVKDPDARDTADRLLTRRFLAAQTGDAAQAVVVAALRKAGVVAAVDEALPQAPKVVRRQSQNNSKAWKRHQEELDAMRLAAVKHREELCRKHDKELKELLANQQRIRDKFEARQQRERKQRLDKAALEESAAQQWAVAQRLALRSSLKEKESAQMKDLALRLARLKTVIKDEERDNGGGDWKDRYRARYGEAEKEQAKAVSDRLAEQKKQDSAQLEFRIDERIRVQRASAADSNVAADAEARAAAEALSREHAEEVKLLKSRHYQQDADMEVQQIDTIAGAELKWLAKAYGKETEELKIRQGMDWREWEKAKRKRTADHLRRKNDMERSQQENFRQVLMQRLRHVTGDKAAEASRTMVKEAEAEKLQETFAQMDAEFQGALAADERALKARHEEEIALAGRCNEAAVAACQKRAQQSKDEALAEMRQRLSAL